MNRPELNLAVLNWAQAKGILENGTPLAQIEKTRQEVQELTDELLLDTDDPEVRQRILLERGDIEVTLIILDFMLGIKDREALELAYNKIKDRKGQMISGAFVKEEDL